MGIIEEDYRLQLQQLFPPGPAFDPEKQPDIAALVGGLAPEFARVDAALDGLQLELNPATVNGLLVDWEVYLGLPDICTVPGSQTVEQRRQAVINKLTATGAPQVAYYLRMGTQLGLAMDVQEFRPLRVGPAAVGDFLYGDSWPWAWLASVPSASYGTVNAASLDCRLQLEAPEYTDVVLGYGKAEITRISQAADQLFNAIHYVAPAAVAGI